MADDLLYRSSNGDAWLLRTDPQETIISVVHRSNPASGGTETVTPIDEFVERGGHSPEVQAARTAMEKLRG